MEHGTDVAAADDIVNGIHFQWPTTLRERPRAYCFLFFD